MIHLLLASWLATQTWAWDSDPAATGYRVYWRDGSDPFCVANRVEYGTSICVNGVCSGDIPMPSGAVTFIVVTAFNAIEEGPTEHGPISAVCP